MVAMVYCCYFYSYKYNKPRNFKAIFEYTFKLQYLKVTL